MFPVVLAQFVGWISLAVTCAAAAWFGARPERLGAAISAAAWILSTLVEQRGRGWLEPQYGVLVVDIAVLIGLIGLALRYRRAWAICGAAFQAVAVLTHLAFLVNPQALYRAYYMANFSIAFWVLGALLGGIALESPNSPLRRRR